MTTTLDIITRSLRLIKVVAGDEAPEANDAASALAVLNDMMFGWKARGVNTTHVALDQATAFPLDQEYHQPTVYLLGEQLAPEYGLPLPDPRKTRDSWDILRAAYFTTPTSTVDSGLLRMPSQFGYGNLRTNANS